MSQCIICDKNTSYAGKKKHLFSATHSQDIWNAILRQKDKFALWIGSVEKSKRPGIIPSIFIKYRSYKLCYACKTIELATDKFVTCSCNDTAANAAAIKEVLATKTFKENPVFQKSIGTGSSDSDTQTEGVAASETPMEVQKLQREVNRLKKQIEIDEKTVEESEDTAESLFTVLEFLQDYNLDVMIDAMKRIRKSYPAIYDRQKRNFGTDWDESLMIDKKDVEED